MLGLAKSHPILTSWLVAGLLGGLLALAGPAVFIVTAEVFLPGAADRMDAARALHLLLLSFHVSLVIAAILTIWGLLRRLCG